MLDFGFPRCRLLLDRLLTGRGRALVRVRDADLYEEPARFICGRRTAFKYDELARDGLGRGRLAFDEDMGGGAADLGLLT